MAVPRFLYLCAIALGTVVVLIIVAVVVFIGLVFLMNSDSVRAGSDPDWWWQLPVFLASVGIGVAGLLLLRGFVGLLRKKHDAADHSRSAQ